MMKKEEEKVRLEHLQQKQQKAQTAQQQKPKGEKKT